MKEKIKALSLPYPDFQLYEVIDPDQFDENNYDISEKINEILTSLNSVLSTIGDGNGSDAIPSNQIPGLNGNSVHKQLLALKTIIDNIQSELNVAVANYNMNWEILNAQFERVTKLVLSPDLPSFPVENTYWFQDLGDDYRIGDGGCLLFYNASFDASVAGVWFSELE